MAFDFTKKFWIWAPMAIILGCPSTPASAAKKSKPKCVTLLTNNANNSNFNYNRDALLPEKLPGPFNSSPVRVFDELQIDFRTGKVELGNQIKNRNALASSALNSRAVVEYTNGTPSRIRWMAPQVVHNNDLSKGRLKRSTSNSSLEIRLKADGRIDRIREIYGVGTSASSSVSLMTYFVEAKNTFQGQAYDFNWDIDWSKVSHGGHPASNSSGFKPFYGDYRFLYSNDGTVDSIIYAATGTQNYFDLGEEVWGYYEKEAIELRTSEAGDVIVFDNPWKTNRFLDYSSLATSSFKQYENMIQLIQAPLIDAKKLTSTELELRRQFRETPVVKSAEGLAFASAVSMLDPEFLKTKVAPEIIKNRDLFQNKQILYQPHGKPNEFWFFRQYVFDNKDSSDKVMAILANRFVQSTQDPLLFFVTSGPLSVGREDSFDIGFSKTQEYELRLSEQKSIPGEKRRLVVNSIQKLGSTEKALGIADGETFSGALATIGLGFQFTEQYDWANLGLSNSLTHDSAALFLGNLLESIVQGHPFTIDVLRPWHRVETNVVLRGEKSPYDPNSASLMARDYTVNELSKFLNKKPFPREEFLHRFLVGDGSRQEAMTWLTEQFDRDDLKQLKSGRTEGVVHVVPKGKEFEAEDYYSVIGHNPYWAPNSLISHLDPRGRADVARKNLLKQIPELTGLSSKPFDQFLLEHYDLHVLMMVVSPKVYAEFRYPPDERAIQRLMRFLNVTTLADAKNILLTLYPPFSDFVDQDWATIRNSQQEFYDYVSMMRFNGGFNVHKYYPRMILPVR